MELGNLLDEKILESYTDTQISTKVENFLETKGLGMRMVIAFNDLPLFLINNIEIINKRIIGGGGQLEIISKNFGELIKSPLAINRNILIYQAQTNMKKEFAVFYGDYSILRKQNKFVLFENMNKISKNFYKTFDNMVASEDVEKLEYFELRRNYLTN